MAALARRTVSLLRRRPAFRDLWIASVVTQLGDWVGWVAVSVFTLHAGGGALDVAFVFAAHHAPGALVSTVAGNVVDRFDRRTVLVVVSVLLAALTVLMTLAAARADLLLLQILLVVRSAVVAFMPPAERAALPRLVAARELLLAGTFDSASWSVIFSVGMAAGGLLTALGPVVALGLDAASFVVAALLLLRLPPMPPRSEPGKTSRPRHGGLTEALAWLRGRPRAQLAVLAKTPMAFAGGAAWLLLALHVETWVAAGIGFGIVHAARGLGAGTGSVVVNLGGATEAARRRVWAWAMAVGALGIGALAVFDAPVVVTIAAGLWGVASGANWVLSTEAQQRLAPDAVLGRLSGIDGFGWTLSMCVGAVVVALAADLATAGPAALLLALLLGGLGWAVLFVRGRP
jgi:MFS family permease